MITSGGTFNPFKGGGSQSSESGGGGKRQIARIVSERLKLSHMILDNGDVFAVGNLTRSLGIEPYGSVLGSHYATWKSMPTPTPARLITGTDGVGFMVGLNGDAYIAARSNSKGVAGMGHNSTLFEWTLHPYFAGMNVIDAKAYSHRLLVLTDDGNLHAAGDNATTFYQFGDPSFDQDSYNTFQIINTNVSAFSIDSVCTHAVKNDGTVWVCGSFGDTKYSGVGLDGILPWTQITIPGGANIIKVDGSNYDALYLSDTGDLYWSGNCDSNSHHLGIQNTPILVPGIDSVADISGGYPTPGGRDYLILKTDGTVWFFGGNNSKTRGISGDPGAIVEIEYPVCKMPITILGQGNGQAAFLVDSDGALFCHAGQSKYLCGEENSSTTYPVAWIRSRANAALNLGV